MKITRTVTTMGPDGSSVTYFAGDDIPKWLEEKLAKGNPKWLEGYVPSEPDKPAPKRGPRAPRVASAGKLTKANPADKFTDMSMADLEEYALNKGVDPDLHETREDLIAAILGKNSPVSVADITLD